MYNALQTIQAFEAGQGQRKERERERTMQGVGNALAGGNYAGGAGLMFNMGDIQGGMQLQQYGKSLEDAEAEKKRIGLIKTGMGLLQTPLQNREAMRPQLATTLQQFGVQLDEQQLAAMDLSDEGIKATLATLQDTDSLMAQYQSMMAPPEEYTLAPGAVRYRGNEIVANNTKPEMPLSTMGKLAADLQAGRITPEQYDLEVGRMTRADPSFSVEFGEGGSLAGITYGSAPKGQESAIVRGPGGQPVVSPGPQQEQFRKADNFLRSKRRQIGIVRDDIRRASELVQDPMATGPLGVIGRELPIVGAITPGGRLASRIKTIKTNIGFDKLDEMRQNSPTGGALGNVTEKEIDFLQAVAGELDNAQSDEDVTYILNRIDAFYQDLEQQYQEAFALDYPTLADTAQFRAQTNQQVQDLNDLLEFMTPEERALFEGAQ